MHFIPSELRDEMALRVSRLQDIMRRERLDAMLISGNTAIFYLSGRFFRGNIYVPAEGKALYFVIRPTDFDKAADVIYVRKPELIAEKLEERGLPIPATLGLELDTTVYSTVGRLARIFPEAETVNASPLLQEARMVKTPYEIKMMEADGLHQAAVYHRVSACYSPDMTDLELQIEIERVLRREGCLGYVRVAGTLMEINLGSVIVGENADVPGPYDFTMGGAGTDPSLPVGADGSIIHPGSTVMIDMNGTFNGYQTDMTRVWRVGEIPELARKAHQCSIDILREMERIALPGVEARELYAAAERIAGEAGLTEYFMGHRQKAGFIGHGVGIELNEAPAITPRNRTVLRENMTLAIEPKFVIPNVGAVGDENTYVVTRDGLRNITVFPEEIHEL